MWLLLPFLTATLFGAGKRGVEINQIPNEKMWNFCEDNENHLNRGNIVKGTKHTL